MGYYKAISAGNADTLAIWETWNGAAWVAAGSLPTTTDDVYTNNYIVTVTTSQSYLSWNRSSVAAPYNITQGGQFQIDGANDILISGEIYGTNANQTANNPLSACVNRLATHTGILSIIGNQNGGSASYAYGFFNNSTFDFTSIVGNQNGGNGYTAYGFYNNAASTFTSIVGNQNGGSNTYAYGFLNNAASTFTSIVGNQNAGSGGHGYGFYNNAASTFTSIVGNQNGGSGGYGYGFYNNAASTFTSIVGNQNGGGGGYGYGFYNNAASTFTSIVGNQTANAAYGFYNSAINTNIPFQGNAYASGVAAIYNTQTTTKIIYEGNLYNNLGVMAIWSPTLFLNVTPTTVWEFSDFGGNSQYLYGAGTNIGNPIPADVRSGVVYDPSSGTTGTLVVPPAASVVKDVPVDNTVGTYALSGDLIARLEQCSTVAITGQQIASYLT